VAPTRRASLFIVTTTSEEKEEATMRARHKMTAAAGVIGLAGLVGAVAVAPTVAAAAVSAASTAATGRVEVIANALAGLVEDGTITQEQADRVADTLDERLPDRGPGGLGGPGHHGVLLGFEAAAEELGLTREELHEQLSGGATLAEIAEEQGVNVDDLVTALVAAAEQGLAAAVEDGRIDQQRADEIAGDLEDRIRTSVEEGLPDPPDGRRFGGPGPWSDRDGADEESTEPGTEEEESTATPSAV
jgi:hypothetical protein